MDNGSMDIKNWTEFGVAEWKTVSDWRRYEISTEGQVRVKNTCRNGGYIVKRFWRGNDKNSESEENTGNRSLCVELWWGTQHTTRRLWKLMEKHWPDIEYPAHWKIKHRKTLPDGDKRKKLTDAQIEEIKESHLTPAELHDTGKYPVGRRWISKLKYGK
jgi:hypothetical protein